MKDETRLMEILKEQDKALKQAERDNKKLMDALVDRHYYGAWQLEELLK